MQLRADQLTANLERKGLAPVYCISGDEPLQMLETADFIRQFARNNGFEERTVLNVDKGFDWHRLSQAGANLSLFSSKRLIELRLGSNKPGRDGGAALVDYARAADPDNILLVTTAKLDKKNQQTRWYKALNAAGTTIQVWPVDMSRLPEWIMKKVQQHGKQISREVASLVAERVEGNLLAAKQELEKLCLCVEKTDIDIKDVMDAVTDSTRFDVFSLIEYALQGQADRTIKMLRGLNNEGVEPMAIFGALMWELRRICAMACEIDQGIPKQQVFADFHVWQQRKAATNAILKRMHKDHLVSLLRTANTLDSVLKGAVKGNAWELLEIFMCRIAGVRLQSLPDK